MKLDIYISHTAKCTGWDIDSIYKETTFKKGARTMGYVREKGVRMLDWDYREYKKRPTKVLDKHIELMNTTDIEVVMMPDYWSILDKDLILYVMNMCEKDIRRVIPVHAFDKWLLDYELAYPNANWFSKNKFPPLKYRDNITHILGGSPQSQIKHLTTTQLDLEDNLLRFKNIQSIDGNQLFNCAVHHGKEWFSYKPHWRNLGNDIPNEVKFSNSIKRFDTYIKEIR